ncbi:hypothetical protein DFJ74DRAFT_656901 [Hyaloraphidium curvatum]|nr:hypothetical protein DFJ74DRAFT_656901 [Hyaloraphidium curvatum]
MLDSTMADTVVDVASAADGDLPRPTGAGDPPRTPNGDVLAFRSQKSAAWGSTRPAVSFFLDFQEASNVSPPPSASVPKPKRQVALSKRALQVYRFREEYNSEALQRQLAFNERLMEEKQAEAKDVEGSNSARNNVVQDAKVQAAVSGRRSGQGNAPRSRPAFEVVLPRQRKAWRKMSRDLFVYSEDQVKDVAEREELLVPIRLDVEFNGFRLRDTFTWNMNDPLVNPTSFAEILCEDLKVPDSTVFVPLIVQQIVEQVEDYRVNAPVVILERSTLTEGRMAEGADGDDKWADNLGELRIPIHLNIVVDKMHLHDLFEWDVSCWRNSPEAFAEILVREERLDPEFKTAIAHQIREQVQSFAKTLMHVGYAFDGSAVEDEEAAETMLAAVSTRDGVARDARSQALHGPTLIELRPDEIERLEREQRERDSRRKRRGGRSRRSAAAPSGADRDGTLTNRSLPEIVVQGSVPPAEAARTGASSPSLASVPAESASGGNRRNRRAAAVAAASATAAMLAADRALDRAEREGRDFESDDEDASSGRSPAPRPMVPRAPAATPLGYTLPNNYQALRTPLVAQSAAAAAAGAGQVFPRVSQDIASRAEAVATLISPYQETVDERELAPWLQEALLMLRRQYPNDLFSIARRARTTQEVGLPDDSLLRLRCHDCPGRQYALGPQMSLSNFEVHLNNRAHRQAVASRAAL